MIGRFMHNVQCAQLSLIFLVLVGKAVYVSAENGNSAMGTCEPAGVGLYDSPRGCALQGIKSKPLRVVYLDKEYVTQNQVVISIVEKLNQSYVFANTCEKSATAIPEWYAMNQSCVGFSFELMRGFAALKRRTGNLGGWGNSCGVSLQTI